MSRAVGGGRRRCQEVWTSMSTMRPPSSVDGPTHNVNAESRRRQRRFLLGYTAPGEEASHRRRRRRCSSWLGSGGQGPAVWGSMSVTSNTCNLRSYEVTIITVRRLVRTRSKIKYESSFCWHHGIRIQERCRLCADGLHPSPAPHRSVLVVRLLRQGCVQFARPRGGGDRTAQYNPNRRRRLRRR